MANIATLTYTVDIECPKCKKEIDLTENNDDDGQISFPLFNNRWDDAQGVSVTCDHCDHDFELDGMRY